jgi:hypothetical protein
MTLDWCRVSRHDCPGAVLHCVASPSGLDGPDWLHASHLFSPEANSKRWASLASQSCFFYQPRSLILFISIAISPLPYHLSLHMYILNDPPNSNLIDRLPHRCDASILCCTRVSQTTPLFFHWPICLFDRSSSYRNLVTPLLFDLTHTHTHTHTHTQNERTNRR